MFLLLNPWYPECVWFSFLWQMFIDNEYSKFIGFRFEIAGTCFVVKVENFAYQWIILQMGSNQPSQHESHWQITAVQLSDKPENWSCPQFTSADVFQSAHMLRFFLKVFCSCSLTVRMTVASECGYVMPFNNLSAFVIDFKWQRSNALL